jgi:predicted CopG family antitoxin
MKTISLDDHAHKILVQTKDALVKQGIENPNFSDAVRELSKEKERL